MACWRRTASQQSLYTREAAPNRLIGGINRATCRKRVGLYAVGGPEIVSGQLDVYSVSDLHTDYAENLRWVKQLQPPLSDSATALIIAGDVSDDIRLIRETLSALKSKFNHVFFIPGNHELWVKADPARNAGASDSVAKLHTVLSCCHELGVLTQPRTLGQLLIAPIFSWHHKSFDKEADIPGIPRASAMTISDYAACHWPDSLPDSEVQGGEGIARWFDQFNEQHHQGWSTLEGVAGSSSSSSEPGRSAFSAAQGLLPRHVLSFSHFLPHQGLLPEKRYLSYPNLAKAVGSDFLWQRLLKLAPDAHVFGHSHFAWDSNLEGIRFLQAPLCYPAERKMRPRSLVLNPELWPGQARQHYHEPPSVAHHHHHHQPAAEGLPVLVYRAKYKARQQLEQQAGKGGAVQGILRHSSGALVLGRSPGEQGSPRPAASATSSAAAAASVSSGAAKGGTASAGGADSSGRNHSSGLQKAEPGSGFYEVFEWEAEWCGSLKGMWSEVYSVTPRDPENVELAPWVLKRYRKYRKFSQRLTESQQEVAAAAAAAAAATGPGSSGGVG